MTWTPRRTAYLLLALTALFWSGNVVLGRALANELPPLALTFWRWLLALAILWPFARAGLKGKGALIRREWKSLALFALLGISGFNALAYIAFQTTTAINAALINTAMPVTVVVIAWAGWRQVISARQGLGIAVSLAGTAAILARGDISVLLTLDVTRGDLWMATGVVAYAFYSVLLRTRPPGLDGVAFLTVVSAFGTLQLIPLVIAETILVGPLPLTAASLGMVAYVAIFPAVLGYVFWNRGVAVVGPARSAMFLHLMPVFTAALAIGFLGEALRPYHGLGMALVFGGLLLVVQVRPVAPIGSRLASPR